MSNEHFDFHLSKRKWVPYFSNQQMILICFSPPAVIRTNTLFHCLKTMSCKNNRCVCYHGGLQHLVKDICLYSHSHWHLLGLRNCTVHCFLSLREKSRKKKSNTSTWSIFDSEMSAQGQTSWRRYVHLIKNSSPHIVFATYQLWMSCLLFVVDSTSTTLYLSDSMAS